MSCSSRRRIQPEREQPILRRVLPSVLPKLQNDLEALDRAQPTSEAWEALNKTLKAIELAALSFPRDSLSWKLDGNRTRTPAFFEIWTACPSRRRPLTIRILNCHATSRPLLRNARFAPTWLYSPNTARKSCSSSQTGCKEFGAICVANS